MDNRRIIKCLASHSNQIFAYSNDGNLLQVEDSCKLCNGTGWTFRQNVIDKLDELTNRPIIKSNCVACDTPDKVEHMEVLSGYKFCPDCGRKLVN